MAELAVMALTSAGVSAGTAATIGTIASVGMTAASAFGAINAGKAEAQSLKIQARQSDLSAQATRLEGRRQALSLEKNLQADLASQNAIFGARGILAGEGSALAAEQESKRAATRDIDLARFGTEIDALGSEQSASNARSDASAAKSAGMMKALGAVADFKPVQSPSTPVKAKQILPKRRPTLLNGL
jgi:hypothetical protein